jgi:hypothetical protein
MRRSSFHSTLAALTVTAAALCGSPAVIAAGTSPFPAFAGRWTGEGRLGLKDSPAEAVKCRATYFLANDDGGDGLRQNIRCATAGGAIEVKSEIRHDGGKLSGRWQETMRNLEGDLTGDVTERGFRITVTGGDITANMDVMVKGDRQIVEIQFINSPLIGLTLLLKKG